MSIRKRLSFNELSKSTLFRQTGNPENPVFPLILEKGLLVTLAPQGSIAFLSSCFCCSIQRLGETGWKYQLPRSFLPTLHIQQLC